MVRDMDWVQDALLVTVDMFHRVKIEANLEKKKEMVFTLGFIWGQIREEAYKWRETAEGATFCERKRTRVICSECGVLVVASSLWKHMEQ